MGSGASKKKEAAPAPALDVLQASPLPHGAPERLGNSADTPSTSVVASHKETASQELKKAGIAQKPLVDGPPGFLAYNDDEHVSGDSSFKNKKSESMPPLHDMRPGGGESVC